MTPRGLAIIYVLALSLAPAASAAAQEVHIPVPASLPLPYQPIAPASPESIQPHSLPTPPVIYWPPAAGP